MFKTFSIAIAFATLTAASATAQENWTWHKPLAAGKTIEIRNITGQITATAATGSEVEVVAHKHRDAGDVQIKVEEDNDGVTICAIYDEGDSCNDRGGSRHNHSWRNRDDGAVDFEVKVPRGVEFAGRSVSGDIDATGLSADVEASTVSGDVRLATTGLAHANTVSGKIDVSIGRADFDELSFSTVSGDVTLTLPANINANVSFTTVSGDFQSDWPMTMTTTSRRRYGPRGGVSGTIGSGGHRLSVHSVSGDLELKKN